MTWERSTFKRWSCWRIRSGRLELLLVPQIGGRIMVRWQNEDLSFVHHHLEGRVLDPGRIRGLRLDGMDTGFPLWGGDKTWLAPQQRWVGRVPFPDLDSGGYDWDGWRDGNRAVARMTSPICRDTGMQITRTLRVTDAGENWVVTHRLVNAGAQPASWAPWGVTMVRRPGVVYLPCNPSSPYRNGVKVFADEGESSAVQGVVVERLGGVAAVRCDDARKFKFGVDAGEGWMLGVMNVGGAVPAGYLKRVEPFPGRPYGHGCVAEVFNSDWHPYLEMEIHGPVVTLGPSEAYEVDEHQAVFDVPRHPTSEQEVRAYVDSRQPA